MPDLIFPVPDMTRISSGIGSRSSPGGIGSTNHQGIDIAAPAGSPIYATRGGTIEVASGLRGYGNAVYIRDADGYQHRYAHMQGFNVQAGQTIQAGQQIGTVGSTGNSTGNHLHYELRNAAGRALDPSALLEVARRGGSQLLERGRAALTDAIGAAAQSNPVTAAAWSIAGAVGLTGECGLLCQFQNWIKESGFFQRVAIALLAFIIIAAALFMLKSGIIEQVVSKAKGMTT